MKCLAWLLLASVVIATPFADVKDFRPRQVRSLGPYNVRSWADLEARQSGTFAITGIQNSTGDGSVPFRQEIRQLQANADQWNLYLLALDRLQTVPGQGDLLSHYSISGVHGQPYVPVN
jgi:hypothetical protein